MMKKIIIMIVFMSVLIVSAEANDWFEGWNNSDKWDAAGDATLNQDNIKRLVGKAGDGVRINGEEGNRPSLVTKRRDYRDVEVHLEGCMTVHAMRRRRFRPTARPWGRWA
jgi:hypothetical protein